MLKGNVLDELAKLAYTQMMKAYIAKHPDYQKGPLELLTWEFQSGELKDDWTLLVNLVLREADMLIRIDRDKLDDKQDD